jgi:lipopolysaccharide exporter
MNKFIKYQAVSGIKWNGLSMGAVTAFQFITLAVLARLLAPSDFGLMGMVMVVIGFAQAFADMGISNAIIYRQDVAKEHLSSLYWLNILAGVIIFFVICVSVPLIVKFYQETRLNNLLYLTAVIFLITPFGQQFQILLQKELKFNDLAKIDIGASVVNSTVAIVIALSGFGVYSLIWGQLASATGKALMLIITGWRDWRPELHFSTQDLKGYLTFGLYQMGERTMNYISSNIDYIVIGRMLGPIALGYYTLAYQIAISPLTKVNPVITKVGFSIFAKIQNDNYKIRRGYCKLIKYISMLSFPMMGGLFLVAAEFITVVYGGQWEASIRVLQILCMVGIFKSLGNTVASVILAKGRADIGFYCNIIAAILLSIAVIAGVHWGINGVAFAILLMQLILFIIMQSIISKLINLRFKSYLKAIESPVICSTIMVLAGFSINYLMRNVHTPILLSATVIAGIIIYITTYYLRDKKTFLEVVALIRGN